jgi:hypothetical protein
VTTYFFKIFKGRKLTCYGGGSQCHRQVGEGVWGGGGLGTTQAPRSRAIHFASPLKLRNPKTYFVSSLKIMNNLKIKDKNMTKQHFPVKNSAAHGKSGLFQQFINLLDIVKSQSDRVVTRGNICVPFLLLKWYLFSPLSLRTVNNMLHRMTTQS